MKGVFPVRKRLEIEDLRDLAAALVLVPALWTIAFGWRPALLVCGYDGPAIDLFGLQQALDAGGDWRRMLYRVGWLGGAELYTVGGLSWPVQLASALGVPAWATLNLVNLGVQAAHGFLALRLTQLLVSRWRGEPVRFALPLRLLLLTVFAFAPLLGWKLSRSHWGFVLGTAVFESALVLVLSGLARRTTATLAAVSFGLFAFAFQGAGQQALLNGAVFGLPLFLGAVLPQVKRDRGLLLEGIVLPAVLALAALAFASQELWAMITHASGDDAARSVGGETVTYSYLTANGADWLASLPWNLGIVPIARPPIQHHEANLPFGPMLLLLALVPWRRAAWLGAGLLVSLVLPALFAMNAHPVSDALLAAVPLLKSFRVPTRALLPGAMALAPVAMAGVLCRCTVTPRAGWMAAGAALPLLFLLRAMPATAAELVLWVAAAAAIALVVRKQAKTPAFAALVALTAAGGLVAFGQRLAPFPSPARIRSALAEGRADALRRAPELSNPLVRAFIPWTDTDVHSNTGALAGLSGIGGYGFAGRRYLQLFAAAAGAKYHPTLVNLNPRLIERALPVLGPLYDAAWKVSAAPRGTSVEPLPRGPGPAWFSSSVSRADGFPSLCAKVRERSADPARLAEELVVLADDPAAVAGSGLFHGDPACRESRVLDAGSPDGQSVRVRVDAKARCPLTVATSYSGILRAHAAGRDEPLPLFPGWGALATVLVPPGAAEIVLEPVLDVPAAVRVAGVLGLVLAAAVLFVLLRLVPGTVAEPAAARSPATTQRETEKPAASEAAPRRRRRR